MLTNISRNILYLAYSPVNTDCLQIIVNQYFGCRLSTCIYKIWKNLFKHQHALYTSVAGNVFPHLPIYICYHAVSKALVIAVPHDGWCEAKACLQCITRVTIWCHLYYLVPSEEKSSFQ